MRTHCRLVSIRSTAIPFASNFAKVLRARISSYNPGRNLKKEREGEKKENKNAGVSVPSLSTATPVALPALVVSYGHGEPRSTLIARNHFFPGRPHHFGTHRGLSSDRRDEIAAKGFHDEKEILRENSPLVAAASARLI